MDSAIISFNYDLPVNKTRELFLQIKPVLKASWRSMTNYASARGEVMHDLQPVQMQWSEKVKDVDDVLVELNFDDRGSAFTQDLNQKLTSLRASFGRNVHIKFNIRYPEHPGQNSAGFYDAAS